MVIVKNICGVILTICLSKTGWKDIENIRLTNDEFEKPSRVDVLLGADIL